MRRIALFATLGAASLVAVSIGVGQPAPRPTRYTPPPTVQPPVYTPGDSSQSLTPPEPSPPVSAPYPCLPACAPVVPTEKMTVRVYAVPDLVATVHVQHGAPSPFAANPELAQVMQHFQLQAQAAQAGVLAASPGEPSDEVAKKLERLKKALRVVAPKTSWEDGGGEGEIEVYSEALCLIVRQTASGHEAIADLLSQLRATQDVQIELAVEMVTFDGVADDLAAGAMRLLNKELSPEELEEFRNCGAKTATASVVRMANGRSASAGLTPGLPLQFTAVASADQSMVEFRTDVTYLMDGDDVPMLPAVSQSRTVMAGKTVAYMIGPDGGLVLLVTPKVVDRSQASAIGAVPQPAPR